MFKNLGDWVENRTGYRSVVDPALDQPIPGGARWRYVFGSALAASFLIQLVTGIMLMATYSPSVASAWGSVYYINYQMNLGWFVRGVHHFGSQGVMVLLGVHLLQVVLAGAYRAPREFTWWFGLALMAVTIGFGHTGYELPWDQKAFWATKVATNIAGGAPIIGESIRKFLVGGSDYGNQTVTRLYFLHVGVLPLSFIGLMVFHILLARRYGYTHPERTRGVVARVYPDQVFRNTLACFGYFAVIAGIVLWYHGASLDAPADPSSGDYPARPEWYFLSLFQMLKKFPGEQEFIGTMVIPGAIAAALFALPFLDRFLPGRIAHFVATAFVFSLAGGAGFLTVQALQADAADPKFQADRRAAEAQARRAIQLARHNEIGPDGASYLLRRDPLTQGRKVLQEKCLSCHVFGGTGQVTELTLEVKPADLERVTGAPALADVPEAVSKAVAAKLGGFQPAKIEPVKGVEGITAYRLTGVNDKGEAVEATVPPDGHEVRTAITSAQSAPDLQFYGSRGWLRGLLEDPGSTAYYGKVPQCGAMTRWRKNTKLTAKELNTIADFFADVVSRTPEDLPASEWETREAVTGHPGFALFNKEGECASCHVTLDWSSPNGEPGSGDGAPNLYGWGSPWYIKRLIRRPGAPHFYGFLDPAKQMPAFADLLSESDLEAVVRYLKADYYGAETPPTGAGGRPMPVSAR